MFHFLIFYKYVALNIVWSSIHSKGYNGKEVLELAVLPRLCTFNKSWREREGGDYIHVMDPIEEVL